MACEIQLLWEGTVVAIAEVGDPVVGDSNIRDSFVACGIQLLWEGTVVAITEVGDPVAGDSYI